jgi:hypothetical protein
MRVLPSPDHPALFVAKGNIRELFLRVFDFDPTPLSLLVFAAFKVVDYLGGNKGAIEFFDAETRARFFRVLPDWSRRVELELEAGGDVSIFASFYDTFAPFFAAVEAAGGPSAYDVEMATTTYMMSWPGLPPHWVRMGGEGAYLANHVVWGLVCLILQHIYCIIYSPQPLPPQQPPQRPAFLARYKPCAVDSAHLISRGFAPYDTTLVYWGGAPLVALHAEGDGLATFQLGRHVMSCPVLWATAIDWEGAANRLGVGGLIRGGGLLGFVLLHVKPPHIHNHTNTQTLPKQPSRRARRRRRAPTTSRRR